MKKWFEKYDILTKALAILIAAVLWVYVVSVVDPSGERTISGIVPTYVGSEELLNTSNLIVGNKLDNLIDIKLSGSRAALAAIDEANVKVEVDISKTREAGTFSLAYKVVLPSDDVSVINRKPDRLTVKIDKIVTATVPIKMVFEGSIADGYISGESTVTPSTLSVMGLAEEVNSIAYAQVTIGKKDLNTSIREEKEYVFHDKNDNPLVLKSVQTENNTVEVSYPVLKTKTVPLSVDIVEGGGAKEKNAGYVITPSEITIAGDEKVIDTINEITVGVVDLAKYTNDSTIPFKLTMPEDVQNVSGETTADVELKVSGLSVKNFETTALEISNIPDGYKIEPVTNRVKVIVRGSEEDVNKILPENVRVVVDLSGMVLSEGQHTVTGYAMVGGVENVGAVGEYKVQIKVSK